MGKLKRKRPRVSRYSPTHVDDKKQKLDELEKYQSQASHNSNLKSQNGSEDGYSKSYNLQDTNGGIQTAQSKISSDNPVERMTGLNMLAAFALESSAMDHILKENCPAIIAPLVEDPSSQVRLAAIGTLRNIAAWESADMIEAVIQQDVLQPVARLLKTYEVNNPPTERVFKDFSFSFSKGIANSTEDSDAHHLIFIHATNVLLSLCEYSDEALQVFNREGLVKILMKHINPNVWSYPVSLAAADLLYCVSEDNPKISSVILPMAETLCTLVSKSLTDNSSLGLHFATIITGVLLNVNYWDPQDSNFGLLFEVLNRVLEVDANSVPSPYVKEGTSKFVQQQTEHLLTAQLIAFEMFSNICCPDGDEDWDEEEGNIDEIENYMEQDRENTHSPDTLSTEILEAIKFYELVAKTQAKMSLPEVVQVRNGDGSLMKSEKFSQLQIRALQCYQNLVSVLLIEDLGGSDSLHSVWVSLGQLFSASTQADPNLLEATTGALRAVAEKLSQSECSELSNVTPNDLKLIFNAGLLCETESVRANLCRMVGSLGCAFVIRVPQKQLCSSEPDNLLPILVDFLLKVGQEDSAVWVRAEALDVLIDLFSDDKTDGIAAQVRLVDRLKEIHPQFKAKYNQQRKTLGDHKPLVLTVRDNLMAFIKYKGPRTAKLSRKGQ